VASKSAVRRTVKDGGAHVNNAKVTAEDARWPRQTSCGTGAGWCCAGKKNWRPSKSSGPETDREMEAQLSTRHEALSYRALWPDLQAVPLCAVPPAGGTAGHEVAWVVALRRARLTYRPAARGI
jgi:hypothetical protein